MKKVIFGLAVVAAAALGTYNANKDNAMAQMSDLQTENVEALGQSESNNPIKVEVVYPGNPANGTACVCFGTGDVNCCN